MANELGQSPKVVACPSDGDRQAYTNTFSDIYGFPTTPKDNFANKYCSYGYSTGAGDTYPQSILGIDRNVCSDITQTTGLPYQQYGYSTTGADGGYIVVISTNIASTSLNLGWSSKMHSAGSSTGGGNVLLGDASVQQVTTSRLRSEIILNAGDNYSGVANYQMRLAFP
jgi:hypothetical protein